MVKEQSVELLVSVSEGIILCGDAALGHGSRINSVVPNQKMSPTDVADRWRKAFGHYQREMHIARIA